jgi:hypothetical protein
MADPVSTAAASSGTGDELAGIARTQPEPVASNPREDKLEDAYSLGYDFTQIYMVTLTGRFDQHRKDMKRTAKKIRERSCPSGKRAQRQFSAGFGAG